MKVETAEQINEIVEENFLNLSFYISCTFFDVSKFYDCLKNCVLENCLNC